jgi:hypothetical protein
MALPPVNRLELLVIPFARQGIIKPQIQHQFSKQHILLLQRPVALHQIRKYPSTTASIHACLCLLPFVSLLSLIWMQHAGKLSERRQAGIGVYIIAFMLRTRPTHNNRYCLFDFSEQHAL